jgi:two-component system, sensor histidine kinase and response regulator
MESIKGRVLIVDDNPKNIQVAANILSQYGYESEFALNGKSCLNWLKQQDFDLVLMDVMMPDQDGFDTCRQIKSELPHITAPVVFVTAKTDRESVMEGFKAGAEDYITKPFDTNELIARVKVHVELKRSRAEQMSLNDRLMLLVSEKTEELIFMNNVLTDTNSSLLLANKELVRIEESKKQFLRILGNEVGGTLREITGMLQIVKHKIDSKKVAQMVDKIDNSLIKMETYVNTALRVTELQSPHIKLQSERLGIRKMIGYSIFHSDEKLRQKNIRFDIPLSEKEIFFVGENQLIASCLLIIMDYLIDRNNPGAVINVIINKKAQGVEIVYTDDAGPLSEAQIAAQFDLFSSLAHSIGFAKLIAEIHHGKLVIANNEYKGIRICLGFHLT